MNASERVDESFHIFFQSLGKLVKCISFGDCFEMHRLLQKYHLDNFDKMHRSKWFLNGFQNFLTIPDPVQK